MSDVLELIRRTKEICISRPDSPTHDDPMQDVIETFDSATAEIERLRAEGAKLRSALTDLLNDIDVSIQAWIDTSALPTTVAALPADLPVSAETYIAARAALEEAPKP
jgi:hypothetical protein